ncbi:MAG: hypothetical protein R3A47_01210 [Polyangiales bacterium]
MNGWAVCSVQSIKSMTNLLRVFAFVFCFALASTGLAQATVHVEVAGADGKSTDGQVELNSVGESSKSYSCATSGGQCEIAGVPGGRYMMVFSPKKGSNRIARKVMIPPTGRVTLKVAAH